MKLSKEKHIQNLPLKHKPFLLKIENYLQKKAYMDSQSIHPLLN